MIAIGITLVLIALFFLILFAYAVYLVSKRPIKKLYEMRASQRDFCALSKMPKEFLEYILVLEDVYFYKHHGFSLEMIRKSAKANFKAGRIVAGGSTITQQLAKNLYLSFKQIYIRKIIELFIAIYIENVLSKEKILELYLNIIYFGMGNYGVVDAARFYFNKDISDLTSNQMFVLASVISAPTKGNPIEYPEMFETIKATKIRILMKKGGYTEEKVKIFKAHKPPCIDEELKDSDEYTKRFSKKAVMKNERFGIQVALEDFGND